MSRDGSVSFTAPDVRQKAPRELVLASAGSGKTFRISSRLIQLLAAGAPPESILASTFTRKAAGEILDRVLIRLADAALDPDAAADLARHAWPTLSAPGSTERPPDLVQTWQRVLETVVTSLHRLNVGTIDSFFMRAARCFSHELGLPPGWSIADEPTWRRITTAALNELLTHSDAAELGALVRDLAGDQVRRSVHETLLERLDEALAIHHQLDPGEPDAWRVDAAEVPSPRKVEAAAAALADALSALPLPKGKRFASARDAAVTALRELDWETLVGSGFGASVLKARETGGDPKYYGKPLPDDLVQLTDEILGLAHSVLAARFAAQSRAISELVRRYDDALTRRRHHARAYRFEDVTRLLGGPDPLGIRDDLYYRLDARTRHILLDEFQDTSLPQWEALEPLVEELLSGYEGERAAVLVGDPKQSIYGWRGAEPGLAARIGERFDLSQERLSTSRRSSQVVLDAVNRVFDGIARSPVLPEGASVVAAEWARAFDRHVAASPNRPGYVRLVVGPAKQGRAKLHPAMLRRAAEMVRALRDEAPGYSIGVLVRDNDAVARVIFELRGLGVQASEEGGNPLTDSPAVAAVLALLRLADHPGDAVARYHVAMSPLGRVVGLTDYEDVRSARAVASRIRRRLLEDGWGVTVGLLADAVRAEASARDVRRLEQLVELACQWEPVATARTSDFLRKVDAERIEDPLSADVRVMTVHQSKGLEFDIVVLPQLDLPIHESGNAPTVLPWRDSPGSRRRAVFPAGNEKLRRLFPEMKEAYAQYRARGFMDELSVLYVAMTRARYALHMVIAADGEKGPGNAHTLARIVREALAPGERAREGDVLYEDGDAEWYLRLPPRPTAAELPPRVEREVRVASAAPRRRLLPRRSPSEIAEGPRIDLRQVLQLEAAESRALGTLTHRWIQEIEWIEDAALDPETLRRTARRVAPELDVARIDEAITRFLESIHVPAVHGVLERAAFPAGSRVLRELPFVHREGDALVEGVIDRLVLAPGATGAPPDSACILDFKTDALDAADAGAVQRRIERHAPQLEAYRRGVAATFGIEPTRIDARLVFLAAGLVVSIPPA